MIDSKEYEDWFWSKVRISEPEDCWPWAMAIQSKGYGVSRAPRQSGKKQMLAHRVALWIATGELRKGASSLHSCDNPACCNPNHLRWGTQRDNVRDAIARRRHKNPPNVRANPEWEARRIAATPRGEAHSNAKITTSDVSEIYRSRLSGQDFRSIAKRFNLDPSTVSDICNGTVWRHCLGKEGNPTLDLLQAVPVNKTPGAKITPEIAKAVKAGLANGATGRALAKQFGIHFATISDIKRGLIWKDA
jgi:hypothetical protein